MRRRTTVRNRTAVMVTLAVACVLVPGALAQSCAMCYQNAANSGAQGIAALRYGILVLLIPTLTLFIGLFALLYRHRNASRTTRALPAHYDLN